jgi:hypothetical protein
MLRFLISKKKYYYKLLNISNKNIKNKIRGK